MTSDPYPRKYPRSGPVLKLQTERPRPHFDRSSWRADLVEDDRQILPLAGRLSLHVDELRRVRHRLEQDQELRRKLERQLPLLPGGVFEGVEGDLLGQLFEIIREVE